MISPEELSLGEKVSFLVPLRDAGQVRLSAEVRNKNHLRYGFEFVEVGREQRQQIRNACKWMNVYMGYEY